MHLLAISGTTWGTAQDLTFGIPLGMFCALFFVSLFLLRSGHERAHRLQVLRERRREELTHQRPRTLETVHGSPSAEEGRPQ